MRKNLVVILGPTASGKTTLAAHLASQLGSSIISADSRQVYKQLNIGTGKDYDAYTVNNKTIPYYLIDVVDVEANYHIQQYKDDFFEVFNSLQSLHSLPILCGGSGLYIDAVLRNLVYTQVPINETLRSALKPLSHHELLLRFNELKLTPFTSLADTSTQKRLIRAIEISTYLLHHTFTPKSQPKINSIIIGLHLSVEQRTERILARLKTRLQQGLIEEVEQLLQQGISKEQLIYLGLEYKFVVQYLSGLMSLDALEELLGRAIIQFAKRQATYFKKMEKNGHHINWIDAALPMQQQLDLVLMLIKQN